MGAMMPGHTFGPRIQAWLQFVGFGVLLCLAIGAIVYANQSSNSAQTAGDKAAQGIAACQRFVSTYADSVKLRRSIRSEWLVTAAIRDETAQVFTQLANLSPKASVGQVKILNLALAYAHAAAEVRELAAQVTIPSPPDCAKAG